MSTRTYQHIIDSRAIKRVINTFPDYWVIRELSERDYGIDLVIEIFEESYVDKNNHQAYESTGYLLNIQVKGTSSKITPSKDGTINFSFDRKSLKYTEKFAVPFILLRVDASSDDGCIYFVWLQKYIKKILDIQSPEWRVESKYSSDNILIKNPTYRIYIPEENVLSENLARIEEIASNIKYLEELTEYVETFSTIKELVDNIECGLFDPNHKTFDYLVNEAKKIQRLTTLIKTNKSNISSDKIKDLLFHFTDIKAANNSDGIADYPHKYEFDMLLKIEIQSILSTEDLIGELCGQSPF